MNEDIRKFRKVILEKNGWESWYSDDNWNRTEWREQEKAIDRMGVSLDSAYDSIIKDFYRKYREEHVACPECGAVTCTQTLAGYILDIGNPQMYRDLNKCVCTDCGSVHTRHERITVADFKLKNEL